MLRGWESRKDVDKSKCDRFKPKQYKKAIARIYRSDGVIVGSGFLVFEHYILTCAHVVADALGRFLRRFYGEKVN
ncbi:MAG: trypsin-like peptidase domain-containing protein [Calothrix sp. CSU_2_0]|nr:trypsin-like peptidase domain-containing protein [Calothrix sp. CSU_2_0]